MDFAEWKAQAAIKINVRDAERMARRDAENAAALAARTPREIALDEHIKREVDRAPALTPETRAKLAGLLAEHNPNRRPENEPEPPRSGGRGVDPDAGVRYGRHLRASSGACQRCHATGPREVDHCHEHDVVRGLICGNCNSLAEMNMGDRYRANCSWCEWDMWLARELAAP